MNKQQAALDSPYGLPCGRRVKNRLVKAAMTEGLADEFNRATLEVQQAGFQIVLDRELDRTDVYPPVNVLPSLSRLMKDGIGEDDTREDHARVASQLYASYARAREIRNLASIIGPEELSEADRQFLAFADRFEQRFVGQDEEEDRNIIETLNIAWELLSMLGPQHLTRVTDEDIARYHHWEESRDNGRKPQKGSHG